jgi:hypothetical protein
MLEAVSTDLVFTISLKRSTQNLQLSTSWAGRLPHLLGAKADMHRSSRNFAFCRVARRNFTSGRSQNRA